MRVLVFVLCLLLSTSYIYAHGLDGRFFFIGSGEQLIDQGNRNFSFQFAPHAYESLDEDEMNIAFINAGITQKITSESSIMYFSFKLFDGRFKRGLCNNQFPVKPRLNEVIEFKLIDLDRKGIYDLDYNWVSLGWGFEYFIFSDTLPRYYVNSSCTNSERSLTIKLVPKASARKLRFGSYAFSELGADSKTEANSLYFGFDLGFKLKYYSIEFVSYLKGDQCLFVDVATLNPGATINYKLPWFKKDGLEIYRFGLNYDLHRVFVNSKSMNVQQLSASITAVL